MYNNKKNKNTKHEQIKVLTESGERQEGWRKMGQQR